MKKSVMKYILPLFLLLISLGAKAQFVGDVAGIEAGISEHKAVQYALDARTLVAQACLTMHKKAMKSNKNMKNAADSLDQYLGCINVMNVVLSSLQTGFSVYNTYNTVQDYMPKYLKLINEFVNRITTEKKIYAGDMTVVDIGKTTYSNIQTHVNNIYRHLASLALDIKFASAYQINLDIQAINAELVAIQHDVRRLYNETYSYIRLRYTFYKSCLFEKFSSRQEEKLILGNRALRHWYNAGYNAIGLPDKYSKK